MAAKLSGRPRRYLDPHDTLDGLVMHDYLHFDGPDRRHPRRQGLAASHRDHRDLHCVNRPGDPNILGIPVAEYCSELVDASNSSGDERIRDGYAAGDRVGNLPRWRTHQRMQPGSKHR